MHSEGINVRWLGKIRSLLPIEEEEISGIILEEICYRTLKQDFVETLLLVSKSNIPNEKNSILNKINEINSKKYWKSTKKLKAKILTKFGKESLYEFEIEEKNLKKEINFKSILVRLQNSTGVSWEDEELTPDQIKISPVLKTSNYLLSEKARCEIELGLITKSGVHFEYALSIFKKALELQPDDFMSLYNQGVVFQLLANNETQNLTTKSAYLKKACRNFERASMVLERSPNKSLENQYIISDWKSTQNDLRVIRFNKFKELYQNLRLSVF